MLKVKTERPVFLCKYLVLYHPGFDTLAPFYNQVQEYLEIFFHKDFFSLA